MRYGFISGSLWGLDTVILSLAFLAFPLAGMAGGTYVAAGIHDVVCALAISLIMAASGRLGDTKQALKTRNGKIIMAAALIGGPIGMSGYLTAISNIGPGFTAVISAFYPGLGSILAVLILHEKIGYKQVLALLAALLAVMAMGWYTTQGAAVAGDATLGVLGALTCVLGWGSEAVILAWGMKGEGVDNKVALQIRETTSALAYMLIVIPVTGNMDLMTTCLGSGAMVYIVCAALAGVTSYLFYYKAILTIGAARAMAANISYSAWAVLFTALILKVIPGAVEIICCLVIALGTIISSSGQSLKELIGMRK